jgi:hypothetical protein
MPKVLISGWTPLVWLCLFVVFLLLDYLSDHNTTFRIVYVCGTLVWAIVGYFRETGQLGPPDSN